MKLITFVVDLWVEGLENERVQVVDWPVFVVVLKLGLDWFEHFLHHVDEFFLHVFHIESEYLLPCCFIELACWVSFHFLEPEFDLGASEWEYFSLLLEFEEKQNVCAQLHTNDYKQMIGWKGGIK